MAIYQWTNGDGNGQFGDQYNWIDPSTSPPTFSVPGVNDTAIVDAAGGTITGSGTVLELVLDGGGGLLTANELAVTAQTIALAGNVALTGAFSFSDTTGPAASQEIIVTDGTTTVGTWSDLNVTASGSATAAPVGLVVGMASGEKPNEPGKFSKIAGFLTGV